MTEQSPPKPPTDRPELVLEVDTGPITADERWLPPLLGGVALTEETLADLNICKQEGSPMGTKQYQGISTMTQRTRFYNHPVWGWTQEDHELYDIREKLVTLYHRPTRGQVRLPAIPNSFVAVCRMIACVTPDPDDLVPLFRKFWKASLKSVEVLQGRMIEVSEAGHDMPQGLKSLPYLIYKAPIGSEVPTPKAPSPGAVLLVKPQKTYVSHQPLNNLYEEAPSDALDTLIQKLWPELNSDEVFEYLPQGDQDPELWNRLTEAAERLSNGAFEARTPRQLARALLKDNPFG